MEHLIAQFMDGMRQRLACQIQVGLAYAHAFETLPSDQWSALVAEWNRLSMEHNDPTITTTEAVLLARIASKRPDLQDPAAVDLDDPAVQEVNRELNAVFACVDNRVYMEALKQ